MTTETPPTFKLQVVDDANLSGRQGWVYDMAMKRDPLRGDYRIPDAIPTDQVYPGTDQPPRLTGFLIRIPTIIRGTGGALLYQWKPDSYSSDERSAPHS